MFETMEKEIESKFTNLLSLVNGDECSEDDKKNDLEKINSQLQNELDRQLENIEQVKEELDNELKKRNSLIEFEELDQNGYFSGSKNLIDLNYFDTTDGLFQKNNCETIEEKDENLNEDEIDNVNELRSDFFNLSRTNLNSVLEEDENEDSSQNNDLIDSINLNNITTNELNKINIELNNNQPDSKDNTLSPKPTKKSSNNTSIANSSINNSSTTNESTNSTKRNSLASITTANTSIISSNLNSSTNTLTSSTTATTNKSIPNSTTSLILSSISQSVLNLDNLDNRESNVLVNNIIKKGVLSIWQSNSKATSKSQMSSNSLKSNAKKFFSIGTSKLRTWKSRYFMLTENYILCFKKGNKSDYLSTMGKYQFKLNLLDDVRSINLNETTSHGKSYSIDINDGSILLFDKDFELLKEWYKAIFKTRQRCELIRQEQELKFRKEKQVQRKEILSEQIERRKLILPKTNSDKKVENLLDKFSEKFLEPKTSSNNKLNRVSKKEDDFAFEYLNNLRQRISGATSATDLNRSHSNLAQIKTNTPIISNRKRMSLQRKSLLSQFDSFLGSPLSHSSSKPQITQPDNLTNLTNLAAVVSNNRDGKNSQNNICMESPTMLPRIAPQCLNGNAQNGQLNKQNKQLTNSCSVFQFNSNNVHNSPFTLNNSPALKQRSLYAERILSNSSLTLSNLSKFPNSRHSTLSTGTSFSNSLFKPFRESIHYATSLRKDNNFDGQKSHLKSATSEFSFIRLTNNNNSNVSTLNQSTNSKTTDDDTLKRNNRSNRSNFNRMHSFANDCTGYQNSDQDLADLSIATSNGYNSDTLRNELKNSKTITNLNSELSKRTVILQTSDFGLGHLNGSHHINSNLNNQLANNKHHYQKMKKINNSLDESDSTFSSSNSSSSSSSNNYSHPILNPEKQIDNLKRTSNVSYSPKLTSSPSLGHRLNINSPRINSPRMMHSPSLNHSANLMNKNLDLDLISSPLLNQKNSKKSASKSSTKNQQSDHTYQKVNSKRSSSNKQTAKQSSKATTNGSSKQQSKKKASSLIPISSYRLNEPIYQTATSTEKRKSRMNKILENQSKIYVTMSDLK